MGDFDYTKVGRADAPQPFSVTDLFASMTDMEDEYAAFVGAVYGDPGTRKTTRAMELAQRITPPDKKILYIYTGQGWSSLKNFPQLMRRVKKMPFIRYEQIETLQAVLKNPKMREAMGIGTIVFDEYNRMQDMDIDSLTKHRAQLVNEGPKRKKDGVEVYKDPDTPEWPEYNTTKVRMINLMNDVLSVDDINTIFVCHTRLQKKTGKIEPDFPNATAASFISMVHSIYYCDKQDAVDSEGKPVVLFPIELVSGEQTVSKNRIGGLPNMVYEIKPIAEAFIAWNADVLAKRAAKTSTTEDQKIEQVEPVTVVEEPKEETKAVESVAQPDDKDSIIAVPTEEMVTVPSFTAPEDDVFGDLFS